MSEHIRIDVQTDIGHVVKMFSGNKPDDLADLAFGIIAGYHLSIEIKYRHT
jgi:hypothetical protein